MSDVKRNEHMLPIANWLRDQINETLARYDIPSDIYDTDILIDALCVCAVDKAQAALRARLEAVEKERDEAKESARWAYIDGCLDGDDDIVLARAERAEAALATARRDAYERAAQVAETAKAVCARCNSPEDNHPYRHPFVPVVMINIPAAIRALANEAET